MSLQVKNLTFEYKKSNLRVLEDFSAEFPFGSITAVVGKNGVGKTTLARLITGILKPESGTIIVDGEDISQYSLAERGNLIGYVMQNPERQIFSTTVEEEMRYGLENLRLGKEEIDSRVDEYLRLFDIEHHKKSFPFAMSHGEKQRLVLAAVLAMKPKYLILDEPTASLDYKRKTQLGNYLRKIDCGVIIISHDRKFIDEYCTSVVEMEAVNE